MMGAERRKLIIYVLHLQDIDTQKAHRLILDLERPEYV
jgi:hypothetical protein